MFNVSQTLIDYGYVGMFLISLIENGIFFFLPGDSMVIMAGILAADKVFNIYIVITIFIIGSFIGNLIGYEIGQRLEMWREKLEKNIKNKYSKRNLFTKIILRIFKDEYIKEAHFVFNKYGERIVIVQRFIPVVRTFGPMVAGMVGMNYKKYVLYSAIGAVIWSVSLTVPMYILGRRYSSLGDRIEQIVIGITIISILPIFYKIVKRYKVQK